MNYQRMQPNSIFMKNCKNNRKNKAKICDVCPFRDEIEQFEGRSVKVNTSTTLIIKKKR